MKKIALLILAALLLCFTACNEGEEKTELKSDKANTETVGEVNTENGEEAEKENKAPVPTEEYVLYKETYTKNGNFCIYEYNDKGHVTKMTRYYPEGDTLETIYTYTYNPDGSYVVVEDGKFNDYENEYDEKGNLILSRTLNNDYDNNTVYEYDDLNRLTKTIDRRGETVRTSSVLTYNEDGTIATKTNYDADGVMLNRYEYDYDENGREILRHDYNKNGVKEYENTLYKWEIEYDEYGRIISEQKVDAERGGKSVNNTYEYDENGGMIKKCEKTMNTEYEYRPLSECIR